MGIALKRVVLIAWSAALLGPRLIAQSPTFGLGHTPKPAELKSL